MPLAGIVARRGGAIVIGSAEAGAIVTNGIVQAIDGAPDGSAAAEIDARLTDQDIALLARRVLQVATDETAAGLDLPSAQQIAAAACRYAAENGMRPHETHARQWCRQVSEHMSIDDDADHAGIESMLLRIVGVGVD